MNENKNTEIKTLNINFGVTAEVVDLARAYLEKGAVDKEVVLKGLDVLEKAATIIATAITQGSVGERAQCDRVSKWWNEDEEVKKDNRCRNEAHR